MNWHVVGASVSGTSHQEMGTPCQDAHAFRISPTGELIIAIADGAGSAPHSAEGAALVVQCAVDSLSWACQQGALGDAEVGQVAMRQCFADAIRALEELALEKGIPISQFATTLTCSVVTADMAVLGQIGDGFVVAQDEENMMFSLSRPQRGEYANEAYFLSTPQAMSYVDISVHIMDMRALALSTDGLLRLALRLPGYEPHQPFFTPLFNFIRDVEDEELGTRQLYEFLVSPRVCARTEDDKTLILISRDPPPDDFDAMDDFFDA